MSHVKHKSFHDVIIVDPISFHEKRRAFITGGARKLQIISDFDYTLTNFFLENGRQALSTHAVLPQSDSLPCEYRDTEKALYNEYYPLEIDASLSNDKRKNLMNEWWTKAHAALLEHNVSKTIFNDLLHPDSLVGCQMLLRHGARECLTRCNTYNIPILLCSAGITDIIESFLTHHHLLLDNCTIFSNRMIYNDAGFHIDFENPMVHSGNKVTLCEQFAHTLHVERSHILIMGDNLHDALVGDNLEHAQLYIKIGFLNDKVNERLENFKTHFDVVVVGDGSMRFINDLLQDIVASNSFDNTQNN